MAAAFENQLGNGTSRFSVVLVQQNDHGQTSTGPFDDLGVTLQFRGEVLQLTLPVGLHTVWWYAATDGDASAAQRTGAQDQPQSQPASPLPLPHLPPGAIDLGVGRAVFNYGKAPVPQVYAH